MNSIQVNLTDPTKYGRLFYRYNPEIEPFVIFLENGLKNRRTYCINIDSAIILDFSENKILQAAEFVIHKKVWKIDPKLTIPHPKIAADIQMVGISDFYNSIETPVHTITDENYCYVLFNWRTSDINKKWVYLSENCFALISDRFLSGFFINLESLSSSLGK